MALTGLLPGQSNQKEREYDGRKLGYWMDRLASRKWFEAKEAILVIQKTGRHGSAAVPRDHHRENSSWECRSVRLP